MVMLDPSSKMAVSPSGHVKVPSGEFSYDFGDSDSYGVGSLHWTCHHRQQIQIAQAWKSVGETTLAIVAACGEGKSEVATSTAFVLIESRVDCSSERLEREMPKQSALGRGPAELEPPVILPKAALLAASDAVTCRDGTVFVQ